MCLYGKLTGSCVSLSMVTECSLGVLVCRLYACQSTFEHCIKSRHEAVHSTADSYMDSLLALVSAFQW